MTSFQGKVGVLLLFLLLAPLFAIAEEQPLLRHVEFAWEAIEDAESYELRFTRLENGALTKNVILFKTVTTEYSGQLAPGTYKFDMRTLDKRGVPGPWGETSDLEVLYPKVGLLEPADKAVLQSGELQKKVVSFKWQDLGQGVKYQLKISSEDGKDLIAQEVTAPAIELTLPVGAAFTWQVTAVSAENRTGDPGDVQAFILEGRQLATPKIVKKFSRKRKGVVWSKPTRSSNFDVTVEHKAKEDEPWTPLLEQKDFTNSDLKLAAEWPPGYYRLQVVAKAPYFQSSQPLLYEFNNRPPETAAATKMTKAKSSKKTSRVLIDYTYAPFIRSRTVQSDTLNTNFNEIVFNSNRLTLHFVLFPSPHQIGFSFSGHRIRSALFADEGRNSNSQQERLDLNANRFTLGANYIFSTSIWNLELDGAYARDDINIIYTDSPITVGQKTDPIVEVLTSLAIGLNLKDKYFGKIHYLFGTTMQSKLESYTHHEFGMSLGQNLLDKIKVAAFYTLDVRPHSYISPNTGELYRTNMTANVFGGSLIYGL